MATVSRNAPCPCGSGKKYKNCHLGKAVEVRSPRFLVPGLVALLGSGVSGYLAWSQSLGLGVSVGAGWLIIVGLVTILRDPPPPTKGGDPGAINFGS